MKSGVGKPLSESQQSVVDRLRAGALLVHDVQSTGRYRMSHFGKSWTVHTATVRSLIALGLIETNLLGQCVLFNAETAGKPLS